MNGRQDQRETSECILQWNYYEKVRESVKTISTNAEEDAEGSSDATPFLSKLLQKTSLNLPFLSYLVACQLMFVHVLKVSTLA